MYRHCNHHKKALPKTQWRVCATLNCGEVFNVDGYSKQPKYCAECLLERNQRHKRTASERYRLSEVDVVGVKPAERLAQQRTLKEVAARMKCHPETIRKVEVRGLQKFAGIFNEWYPDYVAELDLGRLGWEALDALITLADEQNRQHQRNGDFFVLWGMCLLAANWGYSHATDWPHRDPNHRSDCINFFRSAKDATWSRAQVLKNLRYAKPQQIRVIETRKMQAEMLARINLEHELSGLF